MQCPAFLAPAAPCIGAPAARIGARALRASPPAGASHSPASSSSSLVAAAAAAAAARCPRSTACARALSPRGATSALHQGGAAAPHPRSALGTAVGEPVRSLPSVAALAELLSGTCAPAAALVVVKLFARSCRACLGASPRYAKSARAFRESVGPETVTFAEMDYSENKEFCQRQLGVEALPFFAIFRRGDDDMPELVDGLNLAWNRLSLLDQRVEEILSEERLLPPGHGSVRAQPAGMLFLSAPPASNSDSTSADPDHRK